MMSWVKCAGVLICKIKHKQINEKKKYIKLHVYVFDYILQNNQI